MLGATEWLVIALIIIVLFGGKKIPELARGLGKGLREFKKAKDEVQDEINSASESENTEKK
tara:strand:+ start:444 stop:626 length:183 start_codon:yes stop_codon:yes gene_type:complete